MLKASPISEKATESLARLDTLAEIRRRVRRDAAKRISERLPMCGMSILVWLPSGFRVGGQRQMPCYSRRSGLTSIVRKVLTAALTK